MSAGTTHKHICQAVGCPCRHSRRADPGWCRRSIGGRRNWLFPSGRAAAQGYWLLPRSRRSHRQMLAVTPVDILAIEVASISAQTGVWEPGSVIDQNVFEMTEKN